MDKLEKVLKGVQCCNTWSCAGLYEGYQPDYDACIECPFRCDPIDPEECHKKLLDSAFSLLKAQEPRVMTLEEVITHYSLPPVVLDDLNWQEDYLQDIEPLYFDFPVEYSWAVHWRGYQQVRKYLEDWKASYGQNWRCWTSRPTDEQRKATLWTS